MFLSYRKVYFPDFPPSLVTTKFILGTPPYPARPVGQEAAARSLLLRELDKEQAEHGDMVMLPVRLRAARRLYTLTLVDGGQHRSGQDTRVLQMGRERVWWSWQGQGAAAIRYVSRVR